MGIKLNMNILPIKTNDVVQYQGEDYIVNSIRMTNQGFILEMNPIKSDSVVAHSSEVTLKNPMERVSRAKAIGFSSESNGVMLPAGMTADEASKILAAHRKV